VRDDRQTEALARCSRIRGSTASRRGGALHRPTTPSCSIAYLIEAADALLLAPGAVQIYYGDETARPAGFAPASDPQQATRSDMNWDTIDKTVLTHWRTLGSFRQRHVAIAHGVHARLAASPYVFSRVDGVDRVVIALDVPAGATLPVAPVFAEGERLRDGYAPRGVHGAPARSIRRACCAARAWTQTFAPRRGDVHQVRSTWRRSTTRGRRTSRRSRRRRRRSEVVVALGPGRGVDDADQCLPASGADSVERHGAGRF
jgi:hypothetical protein